MKLAKIPLVALSALLLQAADIDPKFASSDNCKACHASITQEWETSLHAKSHYSKNELIDKTIDYMSMQTTLLRDQIVLNCSKCHNPRITKEKMGLSEMYSQAYGGSGGQTHKEITSKYAKDGVNCITCHNVDKIHDSDNARSRGKKTVEWMPSGIMVGPFKDAKSPYHKTQYRSFFKETPNKLCNVCHKTGESYYGHKTCDTNQEYAASGSGESCVSCHMGQPKMRKLTDNKLSNKKRESRSHLFAGARNSDIVKDAFSMDVTQSSGEVFIKLANKAAHKVPTGYGNRVINTHITFLNAQEEVITKETYSMQARFGDGEGQETIAQLAKETLSDTRLKPGEKRTVSFDKPQGATKALIQIQYRLIGKKWIEELGIKSKEYTQGYTIKQKNIKF